MIVRHYTLVPTWVRVVTNTRKTYSFLLSKTAARNPLRIASPEVTTCDHACSAWSVNRGYSPRVMVTKMPGAFDVVPGWYLGHVSDPEIRNTGWDSGCWNFGVPFSFVKMQHEADVMLIKPQVLPSLRFQFTAPFHKRRFQFATTLAEVLGAKREFAFAATRPRWAVWAPPRAAPPCAKSGTARLLTDI